MIKKRQASKLFLLFLLFQFLLPLFSFRTALGATNPNVKILTGMSSTETAVAISKAQYSFADTVVLVSSQSPSNASPAPSLAYAYRSPILFTLKSSIPNETLAEIKRLNARKVILVGSTMIIDSSVANYLASFCTVERIGGTTASDTAVAVAKKLVSTVGNKNEVILVSESAYSGALIAGSFAARNGLPVLLTSKTTVSAATMDYLSKYAVSKVTLVGDLTDIDSTVESQLKAIGITVTRISGINRSATSAKFATTHYKDSQSAFSASGWSFVEALAAGPYAAKYNAPLLLVNQTTMDSGVKTYLSNYGTWRLFLINRGTLISAANQNTLQQLVAPELISIRVKRSDGTYYTKTVQGKYHHYYSKQAFDLQNKHRASSGVSALTWDETYYKAAQTRSAELSQSFSHTRPDGRSYTTINTSLALRGENAACGYFTPDLVMNTWKNSSGHNANMLKSTHQLGAIACIIIDQQFYWISQFGISN